MSELVKQNWNDRWMPLRMMVGTLLFVFSPLSGICLRGSFLQHLFSTLGIAGLTLVTLRTIVFLPAILLLTGEAFSWIIPLKGSWGLLLFAPGLIAAIYCWCQSPRKGATSKHSMTAAGDKRHDARE